VVIGTEIDGIKFQQSSGEDNIHYTNERRWQLHREYILYTMTAKRGDGPYEFVGVTSAS